MASAIVLCTLILAGCRAAAASCLNEIHRYVLNYVMIFIFAFMVRNKGFGCASGHHGIMDVRPLLFSFLFVFPSRCRRFSKTSDFVHVIFIRCIGFVCLRTNGRKVSTHRHNFKWKISLSVDVHVCSVNKIHPSMWRQKCVTPGPATAIAIEAIAIE